MEGVGDMSWDNSGDVGTQEHIDLRQFFNINLVHKIFSNFFFFHYSDVEMNTVLLFSGRSILEVMRWQSLQLLSCHRWSLRI